MKKTIILMKLWKAMCIIQKKSLKWRNLFTTTSCLSSSQINRIQNPVVWRSTF